MKVYAINWVMGSFIDSHIKKIFAQNKNIELKGFLFSRALVPSLNGIPVYTRENVPIDLDALYVDFSNYQVMSDGDADWLKFNKLQYFDIAGWLNFILRCKLDVKIDGIDLSAIGSLRLNSEFLMGCEYSSGDLLRRALSAYQSLNFRALHDNSCETYEGYLKNNLKKLASSMPDGKFDIEIFSLDKVAYDLSLTIFMMKEFSELKIQHHGICSYAIDGRSDNKYRSKIIIFESADIESIIFDRSFDKTALIVRLNRGLLDFNNVVKHISDCFPGIKYSYNMISSNFRDSFLLCEL